MSNRLKELRKNKGLTLKDIQEQTGIKRSTYSDYENENTEPKLETWQKLADFFGVYVGYVQGVSDAENDKYAGLASSENEIFINMINELYKNDTRADKELVDFIRSNFERNINNSIFTMYFLRLAVALFAIDINNSMELYEDFAQRLRKLKDNDDSLHIEKLINKRIEQSIRNQEFNDEINAQNKKDSDDKPETER
ncbi:MAG: helix-turn-helix transcriptional regulator [Leuconostoc pseudomesenteroides]|uniref:helix-turn-helix domain-containing protein n=1 Tax=Leuconostoc pseudomesenteroides TaxID=33968 RepID=UPI0039EC6F80